ncbi:RING zinc finger protein, putative [Plasmodium yoelii]|nr:RING zinc finger protein, putative [Plasmodium yoelii]CDU15902.1 RING zinc finger protein, putative [Plasmodium yoelii]VTZ71497.1 RING zinc finger protein, putative [Plasmodium yoelii]|eukprot:XP_022811243.1 RING zinc finger protein, putative [Plasmodium yoelii]
MNEYMDEVNNDDSYIEMSSTEDVLFQYFAKLLYLLIFSCIGCLLMIIIYYFKVPCKECDFMNRILVICILIKSIGHLNLSLIRIKRREEIENSEEFKYIIKKILRLFNLLTILLVTASLYLLHFYKNVCSKNTISMQIIRIYYYFTIALYFLPLLFYICLGLFLSIIICIMIYFSVDENDRIPTPKNVINKLKVVKYKDIDYVHKKNINQKKKKKKKFIKNSSLELIFDKVTKVIRNKGNTTKAKQNIQSSFENNIDNQKDDSNSCFSDIHLNEISKPLKQDTQNGYTKSDNNLDDMYSQDDQVKFTNEEILPDNDENINKFNKQTNENEDMCSICMVDYMENDNIMIMPCDKRHFFHSNCLSKWLNKSQVCPICRTNIVTCLNSKTDMV